MNRIMLWTFVLAAILISFPASAQSEELSEVNISATIRSYVLRAPRYNAELVRTFEAGLEASAYGRDEEGRWLRILDGWVLAEVFNTEGEIGALPDTTHSFLGALIADTALYDGPSARWFEQVGTVDESMPALVIGRNEDSSWLKFPAGWVEAADIRTDGDVSLLPVRPSGVIITAKTRTFILKEPDLSAEFVDVFEAGDEALAIGQAGDWLQIGQGWVSAEAVTEIAGDQGTLPFTGESISMVITGSISLYDMYRGNRTGELLFRGDEAVAVGRSNDGIWLQVNNGWIMVGQAPRYYVKLDGEIMNLPVTDGTVGSSSPQRIADLPTRSTLSPTPEPATDLDARTIRSLISRHSDDIRILDIEIASSATTIEYDLKPWPLVPNETIANEVAFKIICAIRNGHQIPNTLQFIGHTHFKSDVGRKFTGPSVEMRISASNANRIVCRGNGPSDINWRRLASRYKSYPIPAGASIDYD